MTVQIIIGTILVVVIYFFGFFRGAYKASERNMKAYIELKKHQGMGWEDISEEIMEIFKIRKSL